MASESSQEKSLKQILYLENCLKLRSYDPQIERVFKEITELFFSQEIQQRLQQKGIRRRE